jgi:hypothetical protein
MSEEMLGAALCFMATGGAFWRERCKFERRKYSVTFKRDGSRHQHEYDLSSLLQSHIDVPARKKAIERDTVRVLAVSNVSIRAVASRHTSSFIHNRIESGVTVAHGNRDQRFPDESRIWPIL